MNASPLVQLKRLSVGFPDQVGGLRFALEGIDLDIKRAEKVGLIGASGSGKSLTALAIVGLTPPSGRFVAGEVLIDGHNLLTMAPAAQRWVRGRRIGLVFQESEAALNPVMTVANHIKEALLTHRSDLRDHWRQCARDLLEEVGLEPDRTLASYAHQLSGGQRQRCMIALALAPGPELVIADEPTSSLDLLTQARILRLLAETCSNRKSSLLLISHDLDVVSSAVDRVVVMLDGRIVEEAPTSQLLANPLHPFTRAMVASAGTDGPVSERRPEPVPRTSGCRYADDCPNSVAKCLVVEPPLADAGDRRRVRCPIALEAPR